MRVVQTLEALRKVANPSFGGIPSAVATAVVVGGGDSQPPRSTMETKAESFISAPPPITKTTIPGSFIVKETSEVMGSLFSFLFCVV